MADSDNPLEGPLSIDDVLDTMTAPPEGQAEAEQAEPAPEPEREEVEAVAETEAETDEQDEPEAEAGEESEIYSVEEYGEISVSLADGTQTTLKDLAQGTLRQADYTRKTTELASERKALEAEKAALADEKRQFDEQRANLEEPEPDWAALAEEDPLGWQIKHIEWNRKQAEKAQLRQQAEEAKKAEVEKFSRASAETALAKMPEWADPKKFEEGAAARRAAALDAGFTEQEINSVVDFRLAVILEKAARYDAGQAKVQTTQKKLAKVPKVVKPGASVTSAEKKQAERAAKAKQRNKPMSVDEYLSTFDNPS